MILPVMYQNLAILAAFAFFYSLTSGSLARTPVNGALVFTAFGVAMGPMGLGVLKLDVDAEGLRTLAELTLAMVLFTDAAAANLRVLQHSYRIPLRLLLIGLPLTIGLGYAAGLLLLDGLGWLEIAILAVILAPTDAALGKVVVTDTRVPAKIREGLNVESGLNDGICVPILFVCLILASEAVATGDTSTMALELVSEAVVVGCLVGAGATWLGVTLLRAVSNRDWMDKSWQQLTLPALAVACFALSQWLGGSGFIASFVGGLVFGAMERQGVHSRLLQAEGVGDALALFTWVAFGAVLVGPGLSALTWQLGLYAVLSLTVIRMVPVFLALTGSSLAFVEKLFVGWFGPRGMASIVFVLIVSGEKLAGGSTITNAAVATIVLSILLHCTSANPLVAALTKGKKATAGRSG
jgi:NhaP-type Na+/H+ or K+/H+ antiporter